MSTQGAPNLHIPRLAWVMALLALLVVGVIATQGHAIAQEDGNERAQKIVKIDPGPNTAYISPDLWVVLQNQANGVDGTPATITMALAYKPDADANLTAAITSAGGTVKETGVEIATSKALAIIQRPDVYHAELVGSQSTAVPRLDDTLSDIVHALNGGISAEQAVQYAMYVKDNKALVKIDVAETATKAKIRKWLTDKKLYVPTPGTEADSNHFVAVLLPVKLITPLVNAFPAITLSVESTLERFIPLSRAYWPEDAKAHENSVVELFVQALPDEGQRATAGDAPTSPSQLRIWESGMVDRQKKHGAKAWHDARIRGDVKVGIIDWGYRGITEHPDLKKDFKVYTNNPEKTSSTIDAFCQEQSDSVWPLGWISTANSDNCQPLIGMSRPMNHGVNVAEIVRSMAPDADLYFAQANSPRQLYRAAYWLNENDVDVIVHAGGWFPDGPSDGQFSYPVNEDTHIHDHNARGTNEYSLGRHQPSPLATVDHFVKDGGPVWINAAGNAEKMTLFIKDPKFPGVSGKYANHLVLDDTILASDDTDGDERTCLSVPSKNNSVYAYSLRWADTWPTAGYDLDFVVEGILGTYGSTPRAGVFLRSDKPALAQFGRTRPIRLDIGSPTFLAPVSGACIRIKVNSDTNASDNKLEAPKWIQLNIINNDFEASLSSSVDSPGHSIINPASSINKGLLAVGAMDLQSTTAKLKDYSSRGPVYGPDTNFVTSYPMRVKPDVTGLSGAVTYTKWIECGKKVPLSKCGDDIYFGGTSSGTAHTGGLAALVIEWFNEIGMDYEPEDVADFLKKSGKKQDAEAVPNSNWGQGLIVLPCPSTFLSTLATQTGSLLASDCKLNQFSTTVGQNVDYYTFKLSSRSRIQIDLKATGQTRIDAIDPYLFIVEGPHSEERKIKFFNDNGGRGINSQLIQTFNAGVYTIGVSSAYSGQAGPYSLEFDVLCSSNCGTPELPGNFTTSLEDSPDNEDFRNDANWHTFTVKSGNVPVKVIVNPSGSSDLLDVATSSGASSCSTSESDREGKKVSRTNGNTVYVAGCDTGEGKIEIRKASDNALLATYTPTVSHGASLYPDPTTVDFEEDEEWQDFTVWSNARVKVEVNPSNSISRLDVSTSSSSDACPPSRSDYRSRANGETIHIAACSDGTARIRLLRESDDRVLNAYTITVEEETTTPTPKPTPRASLSPNPTTADFKDDEEWHRFTVNANVPTEVRVNPTGSNIKLDVATSSSSSACPASRSDTVNLSNGNTVYIAGCTAGTSKIQVLQASDNTVLATYSVTVDVEDRAWLTPSPSTVTINNNGDWHRFTVRGNITTKVVVNPTGSSLRLDIARSSTARPCPASRSDSYLRSTNTYIYIAGCATGSARIQLINPWTDDVLATYNITVKANPTAYLSPSPADKTFYDDGSWHKFTVVATVPVEVVANPPGSSRRLEITTSSTSSNFCPAEADDGKNRSSGDAIYLAGCLEGTGKVNVLDRSNNAVLASYSIDVEEEEDDETPAPVVKVCEPVTTFLANRSAATSIYLTWNNPTSGLTSTSKKVEVRKWVNNKWTHERFINQRASATSAWHLGASQNSWYAYRVRNECGTGKYSSWTNWWNIGPYRPSGLSGAFGDEPLTPTPGAPVPYTPTPGDEDPPIPPEDDDEKDTSSQ